jgi:predicted nucleic acid-binding protein
VAVRIIDTNIVSFVMKNHPLAVLYQPHLTGYTLGISFMTVAELREGAALAVWGQRRMSVLENTIKSLLVCHSDATMCQKWAEVRAARRAHTISVADAWIAATALAHGVELVTHNPIDFRGIPGLTVITEAP